MLKRTLEEFIVGETAVFSRTFTEIDVAQFVGITWDVNPYHTDEAFCHAHKLARRIVPGMLVGSLLTHIGGIAAILASDLGLTPNNDGLVIREFMAEPMQFKPKDPADLQANMDKISAAVPRGKGPDVFIFAQDRLGGWVEAGNTVEPVDFFLDDATKARFIPSTLEAMTYRGSVYALPLNYKVITLIYNKKLVPVPPKTSTELVATVPATTTSYATRTRRSSSQDRNSISTAHARPSGAMAA